MKTMVAIVALFYLEAMHPYIAVGLLDSLFVWGFGYVVFIAWFLQWRTS